MPYMYSEQVLLPEGFQVELVFRGPEDWTLILKRGREILVEYKPSRSYEFRSVEKLRYDFERDAENALRQG